MSALDRASAVWGDARLYGAERVLVGDPVGDPVRADAAQDLAQMVTDSGGIPAGSITWPVASTSGEGIYQTPNWFLSPPSNPAADAHRFLLDTGRAEGFRDLESVT
jgi:hypothetical protein